MKILWLCNLMLPIIAKELKTDKPVVGGWLSGACQELLKEEGIEIVFLFPFSAEKEGKVGNLSYISFKNAQADVYKIEQKENFIAILKKYKPDVIHIWGTEFAHTLAMARAAQECGFLDKTVVSIQGLASKCAEAYTLGLSKSIQKKKTLRDFLRKDNIQNQQRTFVRRGENEIAALQLLRNCIGRTDWDRNCIKAINPSMQYFVCNESLRQEFFAAEKWSYASCRKHSIFCAQGNYPIKGFHFAIQALAILKEKYPDVQLRITGNNLIKMSFWERQKRPYYFSYLRKLIKKYGVEKNIVFLGRLKAKAMIEEYRRANVFLSPSTIENSSNAIGEAMLIGTPVVSSRVGGCPNILEEGKTGLFYEVTDIQALANRISRIFEDRILAELLSKNSISVASERHDQVLNHQRLMEIYNFLKSTKE